MLKRDAELAACSEARSRCLGDAASVSINTTRAFIVVVGVSAKLSAHEICETLNHDVCGAPPLARLLALFAVVLGHGEPDLFGAYQAHLQSALLEQRRA